MELGDIVQWIFSSAGALGGIWLLIGKKYRSLVTAWFKTKEAALSYQEKYERFKDAQLERMMATLDHCNQVITDLEDVLKDKEELLKEAQQNNKVLKVQIRDQGKIIERQREMLEEHQSDLNHVESHLRKFRIYIKKLERLLRQNDIEFEEMNTRD